MRHAIDWLVRLYPPSLRRTHGAEIAEALHADWHRAPGAGARVRLAGVFLEDVARSWARAIGDVRPRTLARGWTTDVRHGLRVLTRAPGHVAATVLCLGVGIAASTSVFSIVNALLYRDLPGVVDRDRLVRVRLATPRPADLPLAPSTSDVRALAGRSYQTIAGLASEGDLNVSVAVEGEPITATAAFVSGAYFDVLRTRAQMGRLLGDDDDRAAAPTVVVVSDLFWRRTLGARADALGRTITIGGRPATIVGVAPPGFGGVELSEFGAPAGSRLQFWLPLSAAAGWPGAPAPDASWHAVVARLVPAAASAAGAAELSVGAAALAGATSRGALHAVMSPLSAGPGDLPGDIALMIGLFLAVPLAVLAIGCANVANLQLARGTERAREIAIRMSIGASRAAAVRLLATETVVLAAVTGVVAVAATRLVLEVLATFIPLPLAVDWRVLAFSTALVAAVILLAGIVPSWLVTRQPAASVCRETSSAIAPRHTRLRRALVTVQAALSLVLLTIAALFGRSLQHMNLETPAATRELVVARIDLGTAGYDEGGTRRFLDALTGRIEADARVRGVAAQSLRAVRYRRAGSNEANEPRTLVRYVTPSWFGVMGVQPAAGRVLQANDDAAMAVINERMRQRLEVDGPAVGTAIVVRDSDTALPRVVTVVGTIPNERRPPDPHDDPAIYLLMPAAPPTSLTMLVRTPEPRTAIPAVRRHGASVDDRVAFSEVTTAEDLLARDLSPVRYLALAVGALGLIALGLSATGIYAVMSYLVSLRRQEIGIRMAVGAQPRDVIAMMLRESGRLAVLGIVIGLVLAVPITYAVRFLFAGVSVLDPAALGGPVAVLLCAAAAASAIPARRAARVDPIRTLRE